MSLDPTPSAPFVLTEAGGRLPLVAIEVVRARPVERVVFSHAKIVAVMQGRTTIESPSGTHKLTAGDVLVLGAGVWCSAVPSPVLRTWTIYADEYFLRTQGSWLLPPVERVRVGMHPTVWDGGALVLRPGIEVLRELDPLMRQMSLIPRHDAVDLAPSQLVGLFATATQFLIPALLHPDHAVTSDSVRGVLVPVLGRMASPAARDQVRRAAQLLREQMSRAWTVTRLAESVAMSAAHLSRLFTAGLGAPPIRYLTEIRLTEFARLVEETDLSIAAAAREVGWRDARVAAEWFRRRYSITPSQFRRTRQPTCLGETPCSLCRGLCLSVS
ncbi:helix-turn-helix domain-containing protein [Candidatus Corynebacterium faecigallinarum]|uniref:helix-turn-helix domain-containing protein n=1 Tax=Candidatus Corynebacterium faecigallinarum TaxID=2838528 RepID=UPI003FB665BF